MAAFCRGVEVGEEESHRDGSEEVEEEQEDSEDEDLVEVEEEDFETKKLDHEVSFMSFINSLACFTHDLLLVVIGYLTNSSYKVLLQEFYRSLSEATYLQCYTGGKNEQRC